MVYICCIFFHLQVAFEIQTLHVFCIFQNLKFFNSILKHIEGTELNVHGK